MLRTSISSAGTRDAASPDSGDASFAAALSTTLRSDIRWDTTPSSSPLCSSCMMLASWALSFSTCEEQRTASGTGDVNNSSSSSTTMMRGEEE